MDLRPRGLRIHPFGRFSSVCDLFGRNSVSIERRGCIACWIRCSRGRDRLNGSVCSHGAVEKGACTQEADADAGQEA